MGVCLSGAAALAHPRKQRRLTERIAHPQHAHINADLGQHRPTRNAVHACNRSQTVLEIFLNGRPLLATLEPSCCPSHINSSPTISFYPSFSASFIPPLRDPKERGFRFS